MRTKEVEEAIEKTKRIRTGLMNFNELLDDNNVVINGIDKVLNYIEELEQLPNKIRDKIKEYEKKIIEAREEDDDNKEFYYEQEIEVLKSIIGE